MPDIFSGLPTELLGHYAGKLLDFIGSEATDNLTWKVWKKEIQISKNQSDFLDRYAEAFVSLKKDGKPKPVLNFFGQEIVIQTIYDHWQGKLGEEDFIREFTRWTHWFTLKEQILGFDAKAESTAFLTAFTTAVHESQSTRDVEMRVALERLEKLVKQIASGTHFVSADRFNQVFIFCNIADRAWVERELAGKLTEAGISFFFNPHEYQRKDDDWLNPAVAQCRKTLVVFSEHFSEIEEHLTNGFRLDLRETLYREKLLVLRLDATPLFPKAPPTVFDLSDSANSANTFSQVIQSLQTEFNKPLATPAFPALAYEFIEIPSLLLGGENAHLFDRQKELTMLDEAWEKHGCHIFCLVAQGGVGKTTLVSRWLADMAKDNYRGAERVLATSFYSQGTSERVTSAEAFIHKALGDFFKEKDFEQKSPWDKGKRLAELVNQHKTLLVLDGLEPLQYGGHVETGKVKDPALHVLLKELAKNNRGLCLITTRQPLSGLEKYAAAIRAEDLEQISDDAGKHILRQKNIVGTGEALVNTVRNFGNHALAVNLLSAYLYNFLGHSIAKADDMPDLPDVPVEKGKHPRRVIAAFEIWLKENGHADAVRLLHLMGLFDKPISEEILKQVFEADKLPAALKVLRRQKLLYDVSERDYFSEEVDCHPLIREHFEHYLQIHEPELYRIAHERLYDYYKALPREHLPATLEEMEPLFYAIAHGCRAGKQEEVRSEVYWERISRKDEAYSVKKLGTFGSNLTALAHLFERVWDKPSQNMSETGQAVVLSWAGFGLRGMGRLKEAAEPMNACLKLAVENANWKSAAARASNLSELYLTLGFLPQAVEYGQLSVEYADQSGDDFLRKSIRTTHADALHQSGNPEEGEQLFAEAEFIHQKSQPECRYLLGLAGYRYCELLLSFGKWEEVFERASVTLDWASEHKLSLLSIALDQLSLGRAHFAKAQADKTSNPETGKWLNAAVEGLRKSGYQYYIPLGLLARAAWHRYYGRQAEAYTDLQETLEIAESGSMGLYLVEYHIEMASPGPSKGGEKGISIAEWEEGKYPDAKPAEWHKAEALRLIEETGYKRRLKEAEAL